MLYLLDIYKLTTMTATEFNYQLTSMQDKLKSFAYSLTMDSDDAQDLLQETLLKALTYREKFVNPDALVSEVIVEAKIAFNLPISMNIAFLFRGRKLNPTRRLSEYAITESAVLMIVPDRIIGGC